MKKSIGIIIVYPPGVLNNAEGLSRNLTFLLKGYINLGIKVILLHPSWLHNDLINLFDSNSINIDRDTIDIRSPQGTPILIRIKRVYSKLLFNLNKPKSSRIIKLILKFRNKLDEKIPTYICEANVINLPFLFIIYVFYCLFTILIPLSNDKVVPGLSNNVKFNKIIQIISNFVASSRSSALAYRIYISLIDNESKKIVLLASNIDSTRKWLVLTPFWPEISNNLSNCVVICPDIVYRDFPIGFILDNSTIADRILLSHKRITDSIHKSSQLITFSDYTRKKHLCEYLNVPLNKIAVVSHAPVDLSADLDILVPFASMNTLEKRDLCLQIIGDYFLQNNDIFINGFDLSGVRFIMYTSQNRPNKNLLNFFKAINIIIHRKFYPIKVIITARNIYSDPKLRDYILQNGLSRDILIIPDVSNKVMAALYHLSSLAVNPTLFEGGFPFTFSEAMSVGTPSIISKIPVVEEVITDPKLQSLMLFNPIIVDDIVDHICWGLDNIKELLEYQTPLYEEMKKRTWNDVATEYYMIANDN